MKYADIDYSKYPIVSIVMNPLNPTQEEQGEFFKSFERMFEMPEKAIVIFNSKNQKLISSEARIQAGKWVKNISPLIEKKVATFIFVEGNVWLTIVLKAIFLIAKPPAPIHHFKSLEEVNAFLEKEFGMKVLG